MRSKLFLSTILLISIVIMASSLKDKPVNNKWSDDTPLYTILEAFGEELPKHAVKERNEELIQKGRELVMYGRTTKANGKKSKFISKYFVCTSCHSTVQEDPDLRKFDPEARLEYVSKMGQKFLQGSPFFGIANRESWYNDDYVLKYGDLVKPANKSLAESTQLCAKVCSSGRYLEDWELAAIMAYFWDNQIRLGDLNLTKEEMKKIQGTAKGDQPQLREIIKSKYALKSPATFGDAPQGGFALTGRPEKGKKIFELSCQSCHIDGGVAGMPLDNNKITMQKFKRNFDLKSHYNIYEISRHGTYAGQGKPRYMPLYPKERMSDQQLEDLRAYIVQEAG